MKRVGNFFSSLSGRFSVHKETVLLDFGSGSVRVFFGGELVASQRSFFSQFEGNSFEKIHLVDKGTVTDSDLAIKFLNDFFDKEVKKGKIPANFNGFYLAPDSFTQVEELIVMRVLSSLKFGSWKVIRKKAFAKTSAGLVIDIGFDLTEVMVGFGSGVVEASTIKFGSRTFTEAIREVVRDKYQLEVSWQSADKIKMDISGEDFLLSDKKSKQKITVRGKDIYSFVPKTVVIEAGVLQEPILKKVEDLFEEIKLFFSSLSTNLLMNSIENGLELWGDGAKLAGLDNFFAKKLQTEVSRKKSSYESHQL